MGRSSSTSFLWVCLVAAAGLLFITANAGDIPITILHSATARGAVCLDGSPPAYHMEKGSGSGINNWVVHIEGGGWCTDTKSCLSRRDTYKGSSLKMEKTMGFSGILGSKVASNPDFYNWNRIKIKYCDGSSFTGDVEAVDPKTKLYFRGERIWQAVIDDLMAKGMKNAQNAVLSGCSAGGLAAILHCEKFRGLLPASARVKCVSDAGFFIHGKNLPASCTSRMRPDLVCTFNLSKTQNLKKTVPNFMSTLQCFFPQYVAQTMRTPLFIINSAYDSWQIKNVLAPTSSDKKGEWKSCKLDLKKCSAAQLQTVQGFRTQFLSAVNTGLGNSTTSSRGLFINSCYAHCQSGSALTWAGKGPILDNTRIGKAVGDWFWDRNRFEKIDCPYPCNPTCVSVDSDS
ncbi:Pectin acetylesterase 7 [Linum perenne]